MRFCLRINEAAAGGRGEAAEVLRRAPHIVAPDLVNNAGVREIILALASPNDYITVVLLLWAVEPELLKALTKLYFYGM